MREIRPSGSEGGARSHPSFLPLSAGWKAGVTGAPLTKQGQGPDSRHDHTPEEPQRASGRCGLSGCKAAAPRHDETTRHQDCLRSCCRDCGSRRAHACHRRHTLTQDLHALSGGAHGPHISRLLMADLPRYRVHRVVSNTPSRASARVGTPHLHSWLFHLRHYDVFRLWPTSSHLRHTTGHAPAVCRARRNQHARRVFRRHHLDQSRLAASGCSVGLGQDFGGQMTTRPPEKLDGQVPDFMGWRVWG